MVVQRSLIMERCVGNGANDDDDIGERFNMPTPRERQ